MKYYLAVDIGASSGRHIISYLKDGKIVLEEIYRFENGMINKNGHLTWDTNRLFSEILTGMKKCKEVGKVPDTMGIDTWAVDYALLDAEGNALGEVYGYRDSRNNGMDEKVYDIIPEDKLYERTGIQKQLFNSIYQLMAHKVYEQDVLEKAVTMLMIPDYFHYLLTGNKVTEYTNASTTQLVSPITKDWDYELIDMLGYPREIFTEIKMPGTDIGELKQEIENMVGYKCRVVLPATHDTGSAVMAVPVVGDDNLYISSGTWSLMGTELTEANCSKESKAKNLTNEGGYNYRFRYLKNIMGMWMINSARNEIAKDMSFSTICEMASKENISSIVDANADRFLAPKSMVEEVQNACLESGQEVPYGIAKTAAVIYNSLAKCYADTVAEIEKITGKHFNEIHIVGGGANASYLNELTAKACKREVLAGPIEATAIGNIVCQMIAAGELKDLTEARQCIAESFEIKLFGI